MKTVFALASTAWLVFAGILCWWLSPAGAAAAGLAWFLGLWLLSVLDFAALAKLLTASLSFTQSADTPGTEKRAAAAIRTFYWGIVKLACLGFFGVALLQAESAPGISLVLGLGTLVVVPLAGGVVWSQRVLRDA